MIGAVLLLLLGLVYFFWKYPVLRKTWYLPPKKGLVALMYHHIGIPPHDEQFFFTITPAMFEQQLLLLKQQGYTVLSEQDLLHTLHTGHTHISKPVLLTFDDGHTDNYTHLFPLLQKHQVHAFIFMITDFVGTPGYLTWEQIQQMYQSGLVTFGSHTCSHRRLRDLSNEEILQEIQKSKQILEEKLGKPVYSFCYPFGSGAFDKRVRPQVLKAGYQLDFSTKKGINPWPWRGKKTLLRAFPRGGDDLFDFHLLLTRGRNTL